VATFRCGAFEDLLETRAGLALAFARQLARDQHAAFRHMTAVGRVDARTRVAAFLLEVFVRAHLHGYVVPGTAEALSVAMPLTQDHIGDALGLTNIHVNRMLRLLREDGVVRLSKGRLTVLDPDRLAGIAGYADDLPDDLGVR
jgi:CRP/FNR family transcriptional regulator